MSDSEVCGPEPASPEETTAATNGAKRGRGRPKKAVTAATKKSVTNNGVSQTNGTNGSESEESALPKKRGRKPAADKPNKELKVESVSSSATTSGAKRGRGRPKKSESKARRGRGRPKKAAKKGTRSESIEDEDNTGDEDRPEDQEEEEEEDD